MEESLDVWRFGEEEACKFLKKNGCKILERNYRTPAGEIDIIARSGKTILFVEVKTRVSDAFARPWESVGSRKRKNIRAVAAQYIREHDSRNVEFRIDIISILISDALKAELEWIQAAF